MLVKWVIGFDFGGSLYVTYVFESYLNTLAMYENKSRYNEPRVCEYGS